MPENLRVTACSMSAIKNGTKIPIPDNFFVWFKHFQTSNFQSAWKPPVAMDVTSYNMLGPDWLQSSVQPFWGGKFVEVKPRDQIPVVNLLDGTEAVIQSLRDHAEAETWRFLVCPSKQMLVMENTRGGEVKLQNYLNTLLFEYRAVAQVQDVFEQIVIEAIPREEDPVGFFRRNPSLKSFEARLNARAFSDPSKYGPLGSLFGGLDLEEEEIKVKIELTAGKRGMELPTVLVSKLSDFLTDVDTDNIRQVQVREMRDGKASRSSKLIEAVITADIVVPDGADWRDAFLEAAEGLVENIDS